MPVKDHYSSFQASLAASFGNADQGRIRQKLKKQSTRTNAQVLCKNKKSYIKSLPKAMHLPLIL